jgi:hypothetical protein
VSGEELTIRWGLLGIGLTLMTLAIGQAGWKSPLLVYGLFVIGTLFFLASLFWPKLAKRIEVLRKAPSFIKRHIRAKFGLQVLIVAAILFSIYTTTEIAIGNSKKSQSHSVIIKTNVMKAYQQDFKNYLRVSTPIDFNQVGGDRYAVGNEQLIISFGTNTEFLAFYIPDTSLIYSICLGIAKDYK